MSKKLLLHVVDCCRYLSASSKRHRRLGQRGPVKYEFRFVSGKSGTADMDGKIELPDDESVKTVNGDKFGYGVLGRTLCPWNTIPAHCLANCLRCLAGVRPVATYTVHDYMSDDNDMYGDFMSMARTGKVSMRTVNTTEWVFKNTPVESPVYSIQQTSKARRTNDGKISPSKLETIFQYADDIDADLNDHRVYKIIGGELTKEIASVMVVDYNGLVDLANQFFDYDKHSFMKALLLLRRLYRNGNDDVRHFVDSHDVYSKDFRRVYFQDIVYHILKTGNPSINGSTNIAINLSFTAKSYASDDMLGLARKFAVNNNKGTAKYVRFNADVVVTVSDEVFNAIRGNWGTATLEGGLITKIHYVEDSDDFDSWMPVYG